MPFGDLSQWALGQSLCLAPLLGSLDSRLIISVHLPYLTGRGQGKPQSLLVPQSGLCQLSPFPRNLQSSSDCWGSGLLGMQYGVLMGVGGNSGCS